MVGAFDWRCHPWKSAPSYAITRRMLRTENRPSSVVRSPWSAPLIADVNLLRTTDDRQRTTDNGPWILGGVRFRTGRSHERTISPQSAAWYSVWSTGSDI